MTRVELFLRRRGGFATRARDASTSPSRAEFDAALRRGDIVWFSRGRYGVPDLDLDLVDGPRAARGAEPYERGTVARLGGQDAPERTHVTIPRRRSASAPGPRVDLHRADLRPDDVVDRICTSARAHAPRLPAHAAARRGAGIGDSALRHGVRRRGPRRHRRAPFADPGRPMRLARCASTPMRRAANPFESCLRSIAIQVAGLHVGPQQPRSSARGRPCVLISSTIDCGSSSRPSRSRGTATGRPEAGCATLQLAGHRRLDRAAVRLRGRDVRPGVRAATCSAAS